MIDARILFVTLAVIRLTMAIPLILSSTLRMANCAALAGLFNRLPGAELLYRRGL